MTTRFDPDVVLAKASNVRRCVETIRSLSEPPHAVVSDELRLDVTVLYLQRAVESLSDLAHHVIAESGWELPRDGRHAFRILAQHGLLTPVETKLAESLVGFRNVAVHDYATLDAEIVRGIARDRLGDLEALVSSLLQNLRKAIPLK